ncbi:uncharacterized protein LOC143223168 [Tachypleus tridentatus]|uniref:uncharacterized protein LOC143223168 n=1 Tax=Tachypleus tridentatus TaxID=6853 RepID=UPI003FD04FA9
MGKEKTQRKMACSSRQIYSSCVVFQDDLKSNLKMSIEGVERDMWSNEIGVSSISFDIYAMKTAFYFSGDGKPVSLQVIVYHFVSGSRDVSRIIAMAMNIRRFTFVAT